MLGRQQIAGVPTAISELFKNAHDAYATWASVDYVRDDDALVIRDNGIGMTRDDFEQRWLTLGTSSKARATRLTEPPAGMALRPVLGEKGIGRLAIAAIGPQVLVLTRSARTGPTGMVTAALLHWGMFELLDADLADVVVPVVQCSPADLPDVRAMAQVIAENLDRLAGDDEAELQDQIHRDLRRWDELDLTGLAAQVDEAGLVGNSGTCFVIAPVSPDLDADLQPRAKEAAPLLKTLIGFANTMTPGHPLPRVHTSFQDHRAPDLVTDLIEEGEFFTPNEFNRADHHFVGRFDAYGQFTGTVSIFGGEPVDYPMAWAGARGAPTRCGPFSLNLAYVQGRQRESGLDPAAYHEIVDKLDRYGGLYIYRDGIRVLPYGDARFDWLDVELRRTKSASDNFFSYRRMFGAVEITREENGNLREKAGREGFATNEAYRQFRSILEQFLVQVAAEFFREGGARSDAYDQGRAANERLEKARRARGAHVRARRQELRDNLATFFDDVSSGGPARRAEEVVQGLRTDVARALEKAQPGEAAAALAAAESTARDAIRDLDRDLEVRRPRGVALSADLTREVQSYERLRGEIRDTVLGPLAVEVEEIVTRSQSDHAAAVQRRLRFDQAMQSAVAGGRADVAQQAKELRNVASDTSVRSNDLSRTAAAKIGDEVQAVLARAARLDVALMSGPEFIAQRAALEERVRSVATEQARALGSVSEQLLAIMWPTNGAGPLVTAADQIEDMEGRLEGLLDRAEQDLELTQLGLAVEIINHEFQTSVRAIRQNLRRLKSWADDNPALRDLYRDTRAAFDHLDGYLKLFTPLHRRLYRSEVDILGADVERFLRDVFAERLSQQDIALRATDEFRTRVVRAYPSTLYPVFVNLVDNAIYWLGDYRGTRTVELGVDGYDLTITDTGPGIAVRDHEAIFELGFSRKSAGTGYGLYIAREVLRREGMGLTLDPSEPDRGARFRITPHDEEGPR